jgi:hypothetical protein
MTNAIEQAKREMYTWLSWMKDGLKDCSETGAKNTGKVFEDSLESYLELLRQDHEALHGTARKRFDDIQALEMKNNAQREIIEGAGGTNELSYRLARMTEERDAIQLRLHAVDHAYKTQQERMAIPVKDSGDRVSCEATEANATAIQGAAEDIRKISDAWAMTGRRAKKSMLKISGILARPEVFAALEAIEKPATCMHSFFAIGDDKMKCTFCGVGK